jgi:diacylglycerol kinase (ATP)
MINSLRGIVSAYRSEAAFRQELGVFIAAVPVGFVLAPDAAWFVAMIGAALFVMAVEMLNTAIEKLADHVRREQHPEIGLVKDLGSAAVMFSLVLTGLVWLAAVAVRLGLI